MWRDVMLLCVFCMYICIVLRFTFAEDCLVGRSLAFPRFDLILSLALSALPHVHMRTVFCWTAILWFKWERENNCFSPAFTSLIATDSNPVATIILIGTSSWPTSSSSCSELQDLTSGYNSQSQVISRKNKLLFSIKLPSSMRTQSRCQAGHS